MCRDGDQIIGDFAATGIHYFVNHDYSKHARNKRNTVAVVSAFDAASLAKALCDPTRLSIYTQIARRKELYVGELGACKVFSNATVSHHLRFLTQVGLITFRRSGKHVFYRAVPARLIEYSRFLSTLGKSAG